MEAKPNAASVALIHGGRVLLVQRARLPLVGLWTLPGGRMEPGETAEQCAVREISEELGLAIARLEPVTELRQGTFVLQVFATDQYEGEIAPSDEIAGHLWATPQAAGRLRTTPHLAEVLDAALRLFNRR